MKVDKTIKFTFYAENKRGIMVLPEHCTPYILFVKNQGYCRNYRVRNMILKPLLTLAETIARW